jgi:hypothetical protein
MTPFARLHAPGSDRAVARLPESLLDSAIAHRANLANRSKKRKTAST